MLREEDRFPCFCLHALCPPSALQGWEKPALMGTLRAFPSWADCWPSAVLSKVLPIDTASWCTLGMSVFASWLSSLFNHRCQKEQTIVRRAKLIIFKGLESLP